jgi:hypothetical protein
MMNGSIPAKNCQYIFVDEAGKNRRYLDIAGLSDGLSGFSRGIVTLIFLRLCWRAPLMMISFIVGAETVWCGV